MKDEAERLSEQLFVVVRRYLEAEEGFTLERAAEIAFVQLCRPGRLAERLSPRLRKDLFDEIGRLAEELRDPTDLDRLRAFCLWAAAAALRRVPRPRHPGARLGRAGQRPEELARAAVYAEALSARDDDDLVRRAVTRALRERGRARQGVRRLDLEEGDPLRSLFDLPPRGAVYLPAKDVRVHLARAVARDGGSSALPGLLRRAARFTEKALRPLLGEELWGLCRPVGFADGRATRVLVEVRSSALAHEVSLRKQELIARLRRAPGFEGVRDVRFLVNEPKALPVVGRQRRGKVGRREAERYRAPEDPELALRLARFLERADDDEP